MRESFSEYKKTIEKNLMGVQYLYDGDVNFSTDSQYKEIKNNPLTSPSIIINCIKKIYDESINHLILNSREVVIAEESLKCGPQWHGLDSSRIMSIIKTELGCNARYLFTSEKSYKAFVFDKFKLDNNKPFPGYFYKLTELRGIHTDIMFSPLVEDIDGELIIYAVDKSFQSLVYSIQNMEYNVKNRNINSPLIDKPYHEIEWEHTIDYKLYDCNFKSIRINIKNVSKLRDEKINEILNGS